MSNQISDSQKLVDTSSISVRKIRLSVAKPLIQKNHYSGKWSCSKISFGVFSKSEDGDEILIGAVVYGVPVGRSVAEGISPLVKKNEVFELKRLWIADGFGKNIESFVISRTFPLLRIEFPKIKVLISYADPSVGHLGKIYQATNWTYQELNNGKSISNTFSLTYVENPKPENWIHSRSLGRRFGTHNLEILKRMIGTTFWIKPDSMKYRYLQFLCNKIERGKIINSLHHGTSPYPKELTSCEGVQQIAVRRSDYYR